jgi:ribosomal protein S6E (S10)
LGNNLRAGLAIGVALLLSPGLALAVDSVPAVRVAGELPKTGTLTQAEMEKLGAVTVSWTNHGQTHQIRGVRVDKLLLHFGFTPGSMAKDIPMKEKEKVKGYREVLVATARDGFRASSVARRCPRAWAPRWPTSSGRWMESPSAQTLAPCGWWL